jgi:hypothetical protein
MSEFRLNKTKKNNTSATQIFNDKLVIKAYDDITNILDDRLSDISLLNSEYISLESDFENYLEKMKVSTNADVHKKCQECLDFITDKKHDNRDEYNYILLKIESVNQLHKTDEGLCKVIMEHNIPKHMLTHALDAAQKTRNGEITTEKAHSIGMKYCSK